MNCQICGRPSKYGGQNQQMTAGGFCQCQAVTRGFPQTDPDQWMRNMIREITDEQLSQRKMLEKIMVILEGLK